MKTYQKHLPDPERRAPIPDFFAKCGRQVPPSEITTKGPEVTCPDCRTFL